MSFQGLSFKKYASLLMLMVALALSMVPLKTHAALDDSLVSYWNLNETSGTRDDAFGSNDLGQSGTVTSTTGKINNAAVFSTGNYLTLNDNASLSTGDIDFTVGGWVYLSAKTSNRGIAGKFSGTTNREYLLYYASADDRFYFTVSPNGTSASQASVAATSFGSPSLNTWYYVVGWHDAASDTINIQVNNGTVNSTSHTAGVFDGTAPFQLGNFNTSILSGRLDAVGFWKRVLTSDERTELYASGSGIEYPFSAPATVPSAPTISSVMPQNASATVYWNAPSNGGSPITDYTIEYKLSADSSWTVFSDGTSTNTSATVTGLTNENTYNFRIAAVNGVGTSSYSTTVSVDLLTTTLDDDLVSFWNLNEASGTREDSVGLNDLAQTGGTLTSTTGRINDAIAPDGSKYLSIDDNASLSTGDIDFTVAGWVYLSAKTSNRGIAGKFSGTTNREYLLYYASAEDRFYFAVSPNGTSASQASVVATSLGSPSLNTWYYVVGWHDSVANTINIQVNNGTVDSTSYSSGVYDGTAPFQIGAYTTTALFGLNGRVDAAGIWKRVLTSDERTTLYGMGFGLEYPFISVSSDEIVLESPVQYQVIQRSGDSSGSIAVSGIYNGSPTSIEASFNGGAYQVIDASPSGNVFSGTLTGQTPGQGTLTVRFSNNTGITDSVSTVGLGDIYIIAGQSNASGRGTNNQSYSHGTLTASLFGNDDVWKNLADPVDSSTGQIDTVSSDSFASMGSAWPLLATYILADQSVPVAFVPTAKGGSSSTQWLPGVSHSNASTLYGSMYRRIQAVGGAKAVLFFQGENDASASVSESTYLSNLHTITDAIFDDFGIQTVVGQIGNLSTETATDINNIRRAQVAAWDDASDNVLPGPVVADQNLTNESGDGVHLKTNAELAAFAQRWWASLEDLYYGGTNGRGPQLVSAEHNVARDEIVLTFSGSSTPVLFSEAISASVFSVTNNSSTVTINSATIQNGNEILLDIASTVSGTLRVSLASGNTGGLGAYPTDASTYELPAEPFSDVVVNAASSDTTAPSISLTAYLPDPTNDATPTLTGTATDADGTVAAVEFQMDGTGGSWSACTADDGTFDEASEAFSCTAGSLAAGPHTMYVRATDNAANTTTGGSEATDSFTVDMTAPTITSVSSNKANGTYDTGEVIDIDVTFSENVTSTGNVTVTLETGTTDRTCTFTVSNTNTGTCNYTVQIGDTSSDLDATISGTIADQAGNALSNFTPGTSLATNKALVINGTAPDTTAPTLTEVTPVSTPTSDTTPSYTFSSDEAGTISYGGSCSSATTSASSGNNTVTFTALSAGTYSDCTITVTDGASNISSSLSVSTFTIDTTAPTITSVSSSKANGTYGVGEVIDIDVVFSEAVTSTGNVTVTLETGATDRTCTFTISSSDTGTCNYTVQAGDVSADLDASISGTIADAAGNALSNFTPGTSLAANKALVIDTSTPDTDGPIISSISADPDETFVTITWTTDEASSSQVSYGLTASYGTTTAEFDTSPRVTSHSITITGLASGTTYHFRVTSVDSSSNSSDSSDMTFTTVAPSGPSPAPVRISGISGGGSFTMPLPSVVTAPPSLPLLTYIRSLRIGATGADVLAMQKRLNQKGFLIAVAGAGSPGKETTYFGLLTRRAVMRYQAANGLAVDGVVGRKTIESMNQ